MIYKTLNNTKLRVADSPVHGQGLFAENTIKEGEILGVIKGQRTRNNGAHVLWVTEDYAVSISCHFKYINHSDEPNVVLYDTLEVCALRDIAPGEEIFHDYDSGDWE